MGSMVTPEADRWCPLRLADDSRALPAGGGCLGRKCVQPRARVLPLGCKSAACAFGFGFGGTGGSACQASAARQRQLTREVGRTPCPTTSARGRGQGRSPEGVILEVTR